MIELLLDKLTIIMLNLDKNVLVHHIVPCLSSIQDFQNLSCTNKKFYEISKNDYVWEILAKYQAKKLYPFKPKQRDWKWLCLASLNFGIFPPWAAIISFIFSKAWPELRIFSAIGFLLTILNISFARKIDFFLKS